MREYHAYPLDDEGKIVARKDFIADSDAEALRIAREQCDGVPVEVWCGARVVGKLERGEPSQRRMLKDAH